MKLNSFMPTKGKIFVTEMDEGVHKTAGGIILTDDNTKEEGIRPRWSKVAFVGADVDYVEPGEWVLVPHGRWTNRIKLELPTGPMDVWMVDPEAILMVSDTNQSHERIKF